LHFHFFLDKAVIISLFSSFSALLLIFQVHTPGFVQEKQSFRCP